MRIAGDAMGSDNAPGVEVEGAVAASLDSDTEVYLVGNEQDLKERLKAFPKHGTIHVVHASEAITMDESPMVAIRRKKDASLLVALRLVKEGKADAFVSAGNTGAVMLGARTVLGPIRGVQRSAICQTLPTMKGRVTVLDLGANVDCTARQLCEFAEMGIAYSSHAMGVHNPRVGLLNIGEEDVKGSQVAKEVHRNLRAAEHVNFIGNIEPRSMYAGDADVVVCDGFIGNLMLKTSEAVAGFITGLMREKFESSSMSKLGALFARNSLYEIKKIVDPNESPGAPLLGVNGIVIILHGSCKPNAVANSILGARRAFENRLNEHIRENIEELRGVERTIGVSPTDPAA